MLACVNNVLPYSPVISRVCNCQECQCSTHRFIIPLERRGLEFRIWNLFANGKGHHTQCTIHSDRKRCHTSSFVRLFVRAFVCLFVRSFARSFVCSFITFLVFWCQIKCFFHRTLNKKVISSILSISLWPLEHLVPAKAMVKIVIICYGYILFLMSWLLLWFYIFSPCLYIHMRAHMYVRVYACTLQIIAVFLHWININFWMSLTFIFIWMWMIVIS